MNAPHIALRNSRFRRRAPAAHRFSVGQTVRIKGGFGRLANSEGLYHVTGTLPPAGESPQYRIRSDDESHERVTTEDTLEAVRSPADLAARVFGAAPGKA